VTSPTLRSSSRAEAIRLLDHYITLLMEKTGCKVDNDIHAEIEQLVDALIVASFTEMAEVIKKAGNQDSHRKAGDNEA